MEEHMFQTSFNGTSLTNDDYSKVNFSGTDTAYSEFNNWESLEGHSKVGKVQISYEDGEDSERLASIINEGGNSYMKFQIMEPHIQEGSIDKGRVQLNLYNNQCIKEIYQTVRLKLHPDLAYLKDWEERVSWFSLFEFWNNADWTKEKYPFRVTVNLFKDDKGPVDDMRFHVKGDYKKNCKICKWNIDWEQENTNFSVPFGEWMEIEIHLKEGDENSGKFYMAVTPEGGTKEVIFDLTKRTQHYKEKCPDGFTHFQPLKLYMGDKTIDYMNEGGKEISVFLDDWDFWVNKAP